MYASCAELPEMECSGRVRNRGMCPVRNVYVRGPFRAGGCVWRVRWPYGIYPTV